MSSKIKILNDSNQSVIGEIEVADAKIYEKINDKYTFDFSCYEQKDTNLLKQSTLISADDDYFRIASIRKYPIQGRYEVSCEHVSYELNVITAEEAEEEMEELTYSGFVWEIIGEILEGTRFAWIPSDDIPDTFDFVTKTRGKRSRIIEFCKQNGLEAHFRRFEVATQTRRGADNSLEIELGKNLEDLVIIEDFKFDGTIETSFDVDFIDLNKIVDDNGQPLESFEVHMGDTVKVKVGNKTYEQRVMAHSYNPFNKALPTIELENAVHDILEVIADGATVVGSPSTGNGGVMETASAPFSNGLEFHFTKPYDKIFSVTTSRTKMADNDPGTDITYSEVKNAEEKFIGVKVHSVEPLSGVKVSMQVVVK